MKDPSEKDGLGIDSPSQWSTGSTAVDPIDPKALAALKERQRRIQNTGRPHHELPEELPHARPAARGEAGPTSFDSLLLEFGAPTGPAGADRSKGEVKPGPSEPKRPAPSRARPVPGGAVALRGEVPKIAPAAASEARRRTRSDLRDADPVESIPGRERPDVAPRPPVVVAPPSDRPEPMLFGPKYRVRAVIGEGAMGVVYEAQHIQLDRTVAIKMLNPKSNDVRVAERFQREARALARIRHPGIIQVDDFEKTADGRTFLVMERLVGEDLRKRLDRETKLPLEDALDICGRAAEALSVTHAAGVIHRDLKPANIFLVKQGAHFQVKLLDFGTANLKDAPALTQAGTVIGTPAYMSPEQVYGDPITERTDIHALTLILYELLTGTHPFVVKSFEDTLTNVTNKVPDPLPEGSFGALTSDLWRVIERGLQKEPDKRWASAELLADELRKILERSRVSNAALAEASPVVSDATAVAAPPDPAGATIAPLTEVSKKAGAPTRRWIELAVVLCAGILSGWLLSR
ncbi:MAG: protein kinase [Deltaproteobacteria bacterium]|nr:protein kinase [Deltaproteobacteria bacterium]